METFVVLCRESWFESSQGNDEVQRLVRQHVGASDYGQLCTSWPLTPHHLPRSVGFCLAAHRAGPETTAPLLRMVQQPPDR